MITKNTNSIKLRRKRVFLVKLYFLLGIHNPAAVPERSAGQTFQSDSQSSFPARH